MAKPPPEHISANVFPGRFNNITCLKNPIQEKLDVLNEELLKKGARLVYVQDGIIPRKINNGW